MQAASTLGPALVGSWFWAPEYWLARVVVQRLLAFTYLLGFTTVVHQLPALLADNGLTPIRPFLRIGFRRAPSLFHLHYSDRACLAVAWVGVVVSAALLLGLPDLLSGTTAVAVGMACWALLWALYLSIVNVGQVWYSFGWESLLLEAGFLAIFLGPASTAPPAPVIWLLCWLLFRVEFGAGMIKIRGDRCWRDLTALYYHHETQPMPGPLSRSFHQLPRPLHRAEVAANHFTQLLVPFFLFAPQPAADVAALLVVLTQLWLMLSGNFAWLNFLTITLAFSAMNNALLGSVLPVQVPAVQPPSPAWHQVAVIALTAMMVVLSYWPARNLLSRQQVMNRSFNKLHLGNTYGAFGSVTRTRHEVVVEGTSDPDPGEGTAWYEYEFPGKPGDPLRRPPQVAPYHLRLDWLMWFAAISPGYASPWLPRMLKALLQGNAEVDRLLRHNPFPDEPPKFVRAQLYRYRFTTKQERQANGAWWERTFVTEYVPPVSLEDTRIV